MYEVEVKAQLKDRQAVKGKLESLGCVFGEELHQVDTIFVPKGTPYPSPMDTPVLRVRRQNGKAILTLKISQSSRQDCIEKELEVADGNIMVDIIHLIGYEEFVAVVDKKRIKTHVGDMEVVLDEVKDLGEFIEVEKVVTEADPAVRVKTQDELYAFLETLGVSKEDHVIGGKYDIMLYEKLNSK
ncbi:MAG: class IV adenylate cyclase [Candidatus Pacebacteria bacterium]|nr:class IV adenylate cyclase [Candidatus Paceibacterota bacterium]